MALHAALHPIATQNNYSIQVITVCLFVSVWQYHGGPQSEVWTSSTKKVIWCWVWETAYYLSIFASLPWFEMSNHGEIYICLTTLKIWARSKNLSQIWKIWAKYGKSEPNTEKYEPWLIFFIFGSYFSYLAQIFGLSGFWLSNIRDVLVIIVVY